MVAVKLTLAVLAVVIGVAAAITNPTTCSQPSDIGFYCVNDPAYINKYFWCSNPGPASIPSWFNCAPGTICGTQGQNSHNPCTFSADLCPNDPAKTVPGVCGCGVADVNTDGDAKYDCQETCPTDPAKTAPGVCGCGVADVNTDGDAKFDCEETCDNDPLKTEPGVCGCGVADVNTDGDAKFDCEETCDNDPLKTAPGVCGCGVADTDANSNSIVDCLEPCPNTSDICCGLNNGFTCQGTQNTGFYIECSKPFFAGQRACAPGTKCVAGGFVTQNPCI